MRPGEVDPPDWWRDTEQAFGRLLRTPLESGGGRFESRPERFDPSLVAALAGDPSTALRLHHEQYWMRLFGVMQECHPRSCRVLGPFRFNRIVARFLQRHPPAAHDLAATARPFGAWLRGALDAVRPSVPTDGYGVIDEAVDRLAARSGHGADPVLRECRTPWTLLAQALALDEAWSHALRSPIDAPWTPTPQELARLAGARWRHAASFSLVRADWQLEATADDAPPFDPVRERLPRPRYHVTARTADGVAELTVEAAFARLLSLAQDRPFGAVLEALEQAVGLEGAEPLRASLPAWLQTARERGWWVGLAAP